MLLSLFALTTLGGSAVTSSFAASGKHDKNNDPQFLSLSPMAVERGQTVQLTVRGRGLDGVSAVWFEKNGLRAELQDFQPATNEVELKGASKKDTDSLRPVIIGHVRLTVDGTVAPGDYSVRLVTPHGLSNPVSVWVAEAKTVEKSSGSHETFAQAQSVSLPTVVTGEVTQRGQLDYYSFVGRRDEKVSIKVLGAQNFDARLALYEPGGSWFDPSRGTRLLSDQEQSTDLIPTQSEGDYVLPHDGKYFVEVSGIYGEGCSGCVYMVDISPTHSGMLAVESRPSSEWAERSFSRPLDSRWMATIAERSVPNAVPPAADSVIAAGAGAGDASAVATHAVDTAPQFKPGVPLKTALASQSDTAKPQMIGVPGMAEGTLSHPGDIQSFHFIVSPGEKLAFELQTLGEKPPTFNPRIGIENDQDKELFSNVHRAISLFNNNGEKHVYLKGVEPKVVYTFARGGTYTLQVRDITSDYAGKEYRYRVLIRPQYPHIGDVDVLARPPDLQPQGKVDIVDLDHLNLVPGKTQKLDLQTSYEEGFAGDVYFTLKGLPAGVSFLPGGEYRKHQDPTDIDEDPDLVGPKIEPSTIVLLAAPDAPPTRLPVLAHLYCRPVVNGIPGEEFRVKDIPVMVLASVPVTKTRASTSAR